MQDLVAQLRDEISRLQMTLDNVGASVFTKDMDGTYTYANAMMCQILGLNADDIIGHRKEDFYDLSLSNELTRHDQRVLRDGERVEGIEWNYIRARSERRAFWVVKIPLKNEADQVQGLIGIATDVTDRIRAERQLAEQKEMLTTVLDNIDAYVYMKDADQKFQYINEKTAQLIGVNCQDVVGKSDADIFDNVSAENVSKLDQNVFETGARVAGEETLTSMDGETLTCWAVKLPIMQEGKVSGLVGISTDITPVIKEKNHYHRLARIDHLTGVLTRRFFLEQARVSLNSAMRRGGTVALMLMDLDHFKPVNDQYGHPFGDEYLKTVTQELQRLLRDGDFVGRIGGDEFAIMIHDVSEETLKHTVSRLMALLLAFKVQTPTGEALEVSLSLGITMSRPTTTLDQMMIEADIALYQSKAAGRRQWSYYTPEMRDLPDD